MQCSIRKNIDEVVKNHLCLCCGACMGVCPQNAIQMTETAFGLLHPQINSDACNNCGLCLKVCPGNHLEKGLLSPQTDPFKGNVISAYSGRAVDARIRQNGQSGGIAAALLKHLLDSGRISNGVVTQMPQDNLLRPGGMVITRSDDICKNQGSQYCPVAIAAAARKATICKGEKIAVVGLPCHFHGIENTRLHLGKQTPIKIGLICDRMLAFRAIDYLIDKAGVNRGDVEFFQFRSKKFSGWPGDVLIRTKDGRELCVADRHRRSAKDFFTPARCRLCFDKMNALCDIVVGDAWGVREHKDGFSVIITRTARGQDIVSSAQKAGIIDIESADAGQIFEGQKVEKKRRDWTQFMNVWRDLGIPAPSFNFDAKWFADIAGLDSLSYRDKINRALNLENMTGSSEVLLAAEGVICLKKKQYSLPFRGIGRLIGKIWKHRIES